MNNRGNITSSNSIPYLLYETEELQPKVSETSHKHQIIHEVLTSSYESKADTISNSRSEEFFGSRSEKSRENIIIPVKTEVTTVLASMFQSEDFETGVTNPSEKYFHELMKDEQMSLFNALQFLFLNNFSLDGRKIKVLIGILHIISHMRYEEVYPLGQSMAIMALTHSNNEVAEFGVKCFENWAHPDGIEKLNAVRFSTQWLQEYANEVIAELSEGV